MFVYFFDSIHFKWFEFATTGINTIFAVCVFSIPLQAHSQKQRGKLESSSSKHCLSDRAQLTQAARLMVVKFKL